ncbi:MAG TPA: TonB-dependent receptor [Rhizomicrobium sp.]|nr:TonB-dependent receptor [Rhizomicrobium sp.]
MNSIHRALLCGTSAIAISAALVFPAFAADDEIETVVVTGIRASLRDSLEMKRKSPLVTENISTKDIGQLPDVTIAEELNRLPGVNTQRDRGNASQASIRGLGPRFVFGLVNGREIASSEPTQDVRWEIFPSEILGGVQVYKTQDAALIPGGIAATIDIRTTNPLDYEGPSLQLRSGPTYNDEADKLPHYDGLGFRGSAGYISHLTDNFAIAIAGSVQREKNGFPDMTSWGENQCGAPEGGAPGNLNAADSASGVIDCSDPASRALQTPTPWGGQTEIKLIDQDRYGLAGAAAWRATPDLVIKADALWSNYQINEHQIQQWYNAGNTWGNWQNSNYDLYHNPGSSFTLDDQGHVVAATLDATAGGNWLQVNNYLAHYREAHTEVAGGLNFDWTHGSWNAKLDLSHSEAWRNNQWIAFGTAGFTPISSFDYRADRAPMVATPGYNPADTSSQFASQHQDAGPEYSRDHINAVTFDASDAIDGSFFTALDFGGRYSDRYKSHHRYDYLLPFLGADSSNPLGPSIFLPTGDLQQFRVDGYNTPYLLWGDWDALQRLVYGPDGNTGPDSATLLACGQACATAGTSALSAIPFDNTPARWQVKEITGEGYAKVEFAHDIGTIPMTGSLGVRIDDVDTTSTGFQTTDGGATFQPVTVKNHYTEVLPSLNMSFHLADDQMLRFGAAIATSRPPLDALRTGYSLNPLAIPTPNGSGGNPTLKPFKSNQVDLSYEWYFHDESLFSAAVYYKDISTFIGIASSQQTINGVNYTISSPANGKGGGVDGIELALQTRLYFLPGALGDFGVYTNYSYADSDIKEFSPQFNPYPMGGLTKHTAEFDLFYNRAGFEARAAFKYHSRFTLIPGWDGGQLFSLAPEQTLDLSASYQWNEHIGLRFQIGNVTNEKSRDSTDNDVNDLARYDEFGRRFLFDISYRN